MIYYVDNIGNVTSGTDSNDLDGITALHGASYAVQIDDATASSVVAGREGMLAIAGLTPGQPNVYGIPTATGTLTFTPTPAETLLANAQQAKITLIEMNLANAISTFPSSALGTQHTYLADPKSMAFLNSQYSFVTGPDYDQSAINWFTVENDMQPHTGAQIRQVFLDGRAWVKAQESHKDDLVAQVKGATSPDAVNAIASW